MKFKEFVEAKARLVIGPEGHPLLGQTSLPNNSQATSQDQPINSKKLDTNTSPQQVLGQFISATQRALENGALNDPEQTQKIVDFNVRKLSLMYGANAGEVYQRKVLAMISQMKKLQDDTK